MSAGERSLRFDGQVAVITGAGRGIGREYALELARRGATVLVNDVGVGVDGKGESTQPATEVVEVLRAQGATAEASTDDIGTEAGAQALIDAALSRFGRIDALIHNAGVANASWRQTVDVSLSAGFWLARAAWPTLVRQSYGRLVMTSSAAGLFGTRPADEQPLSYYAYGAAKMGLIGLTRNLALEGAASGIKVNAIAPVAWSRMIDHNLEDPKARAWMRDNFDARHIVPATVLLSHADCPGSGQVYSVGGGRVARVEIGEAEGFFDPALTAETLQANFARVGDREGMSFPRHIPDELALYHRICGID